MSEGLLLQDFLGRKLSTLGQEESGNPPLEI